MIPATRSAARRHTHRPNGHDVEVDLCPVCGTSIQTKDARDRVRARLAQLAQQAAEHAQTEITAQVRRVQQEAAASTKAAVEKAQREATTTAQAAIAKAKKDAAAQVTKAKQDAAAGMAGKVAEAVNAEKARGYAERLKITNNF